MSDSVRPHRRQPTRPPCPWDSPGKNTGVGCHFLLQCMKVKSESKVAQSCPTLSDPMDRSLPGSCIHGIFQARALEWVPLPSPPSTICEDKGLHPSIFSPVYILFPEVRLSVQCLPLKPTGQAPCSGAVDALRASALSPVVGGGAPEERTFLYHSITLWDFGGGHDDSVRGSAFTKSPASENRSTQPTQNLAPSLRWGEWLGEVPGARPSVVLQGPGL